MYAVKIGPALAAYPLKAVTIPLIMAIIKNKRIAKKFISSSRIPNLVLGDLLFIAILVSFPVIITIAYILPVANTVLAHIACSKLKGSLLELLL